MDQDIPTYTGEEKEKKWQQEKEAFIHDLQEERQKRHSLEERLSQLETRVPNKNGEMTPEQKVQLLAQDPDGYIERVVEERIVKKKVEPLQKQVEQVDMGRKLEHAQRWLAKQFKKDEDEFEGSEEQRDVIDVMKRHELFSREPRKDVEKAHKIYLQEKKEKEQREEKRNETIQGNRSEVVRTPVRTGSMRFSRSQIASMSREEYERKRDDIREAQAAGLISEN